MILHEIELHSVGPFRDGLRLGPLRQGLNILAAPNEAGKTTALRAAARALFDRHTTRGEEMKSLQPSGTELSPRIAVDFETAQGRFLIQKSFLQTPTSSLRQRHGESWELISEGDAADRKVQELLSASLPGRGLTKPEHWGFLGFLWARQGESASWPTLDDEAVGQKIRARLAQVELDPVIERLRGRLLAISEELLTATGRTRTQGPLDAAERELESIECSLAEIQKTRSEIEATQQRYQQSLASLAQVEREQGDREAAARTLAEQAAASELLKVELDAKQTELTAAKEKLETVSKEAKFLEAHQTSLAAAKSSLEAASAAVRQAEAQVAHIRTELDAQQSARPAADQKLAALREELQRIQWLLKLREASAHATRLLRQREQAGQSAAALSDLKERLAGLPAVNPTKLSRIEKLVETVNVLRARVQALGLSVELTPAHETSATVAAGGTPRVELLPAGRPTLLHSPEVLDLELEGWGHLTIRAGGEEGRTAAADLSKAEQSLQSTLHEAGIPNLEAARKVVSDRKELEIQIKAATAAHTQHLGDSESFESLREAAAAAQGRLEVLTTSVRPTPSESAPGQAELEASEARLAAAIPPAAKELEAVDKALDRLRADEQKAIKNCQTSTTTANEYQTQVRTLESQIAAISERYPEGIEAAKSRAATEFVQAEARVKVTKDRLPQDYEQLPERNRRAATALQQLLNELQALRTERDHTKGALESQGLQGLYSREAQLQEKQSEVQIRRDAARSRGWAARIAHDLIAHRKQAATRAVLRPLEDRLSTAFASLTGDSERRVFLNDALQVDGLGCSRDAIYPFESLSQGAREQLLLCLRIAVAQELAKEEPQTLILDDVLVNTDPVRQERVLSLLGSLATDLQILILTCHPDRTRGAGTGVAFARLT